MGVLTDHDLVYYKTTHDLIGFIETGFEKGAGCAHALDSGFEDITSIEISEEYVKNGNIFYGNLMDIIKGDSSQVLPELLEMYPTNINVLFWLDAHLPGWPNKEAEDTDTCFPLQKELEAIKEFRLGKDVIIIDDLRIYENGPYEAGNWGEFQIGIQFIKDLFEETHNFIKDYRKQGYLILIPKK